MFLRIIFFFYRDFDRLSKENILENNELVGLYWTVLIYGYRIFKLKLYYSALLFLHVRNSIFHGDIREIRALVGQLFSLMVSQHLE